ncbi:hypothetical protein CAPTEDRAFT_192080 [Capitella teleta]|uniref:Retinoblastoma-associated protein A-box domain-containing protein n=1 Tax=Capitella teleta TaxID=283909 RepID=R7UQJ4_CAPTE|nr:hypothetical protein CAPTEDRAFT_192080 [Capitella teleta]|eukprot:ELU08799.1 hypothetical protein CAPTEDRAFT_192080 [Capitella teleta]
MGQSDDGDSITEKRYEDLCLDLNMDKNAKDDAWISFERITHSYTLEASRGDAIHWLTCALYVSCRKSLVPTVGRGIMEGNGVSLTRLLRSSKLSLIEFFKKMKKWLDMANLPEEFRSKVDRLERNFSVSTVIFKKYKPIFLDLFNDPAKEAPRPPRSRKQKYVILITKCPNRGDLLNRKFPGLPEKFDSKDYRPPTETPCIVQLLSERHEGLLLEAKGIKAHWWQPYITKLFDNKDKTINGTYEEYVLNLCDLDERIFLGDEAYIEIGTPAKSFGDFAHQMQMHAGQMKQHVNETRSLAPLTPLTGRRYLSDKDGEITPVSTATQSVSRLQSLLSGRKTSPSECLLEIFKLCSRNPHEDIMARVKEMGETFCERYAQPSDDHPGSHVDFAKKRLQLGESLYFKALENVMKNEMKRKQVKEAAGKTTDFSNLLEQDIFHRSLFASCLEIVIFSYNSQRAFPWIIDVFNLDPYHFYKVIEVLVRAEEGLSRDVVKHMNHIEELILDSLAWKDGSMLWDAIKQFPNGVPSVEEVSLPRCIESATNNNNNIQSPMVNPVLRRIVVTDRSLSPVVSRSKDPMQSPTGVLDRFSSPGPDNRVVRNLFGRGPGGSVTVKPLQSGTVISTTSSVGTPVARESLLSSGNIKVFKQLKGEDGKSVLIPVTSTASLMKSPPPVPPPAQKSDEEKASNVAAGSATEAPPSNKPKKSGSLPLFFRKVYHLASVRLRDLCERLDVDCELRAKIWTCFEHVLMEHIELMRDRHLDQMIMSSVYVMSKVTEKDTSFQEIMRCYRLQPQAQSHVYRSVLLTSRKRHSSGDSTVTSRSASPVEAARTERLSTIRSTSTLPAATPASQPPTPTRLAGTGTAFEFEDRGEDRGDLIKFYNSVYVKKIKAFALRFSAHNIGKTGEAAPILSPLPVVRPHPLSPRCVSSKHSIYVSPRKNQSLMTPHTKMLYCFNRSPARDLSAINNMIRRTTNVPTRQKRLLQEDEDKSEGPSSKKCRDAVSDVLGSRLGEVMAQRQANGAR